MSNPGLEEVREVLRPVRVNLRCPKCNDGFMHRSNDGVLLSNPPKYEHKCSKCGTVLHLTEVYPKLEYEVVES